MTKLRRVPGLVLGLLVAWLTAAVAGWNADTVRSEDTLEFFTVHPGEEDGHWSTVWVVVLDGEPYVRLGSRAADRVVGNVNAPFVRVRVAGEEFDHVRAEPAPDMAEPVAEAMAEKYWSDLLIRFVPHPLTIRLVPFDGTLRPE